MLPLLLYMLAEAAPNYLHRFREAIHDGHRLGDTQEA